MNGLARTGLATVLLWVQAGCASTEVQDEPRAGFTAAGSDSVAAAVLQEGEAAYHSGEYDSAIQLLERALELSGAVEDSTAYARALTWLGLTAWRQGRHADARRLQQAALELKRRRAMHLDLFRSLNALGLLANSEGRPAEAVHWFTQAVDAARAADDSIGIARALGNVGLPYLELGEFDRARDAFVALQHAAPRLGDARAEAAALSNLALLDIRLGDAMSAIEPLKRARVLHAAAGSVVGEENALGQLGTAYAELGDPRRAIVYLDSALRLSRAHGLSEQEIENLQLLALVLGGIGDNARALEYLGQARALATSLGHEGRLGRIARAEAGAYVAIGRGDLAASRARAALAAHTAAGFRLEQLFDHLLIAEIVEREGNRRHADEELRKAESLARRIGAPVGRGSVALSRARIADARRDTRAVHGVLSTRRGDIASLGPHGEWEAYALEARAYAREGSLEEAAAAGRAAVATVEMVRERITAGPLRTTFTAERATVYGDLVVVLLRLNRVAEAFSVADAARSRALVEHISTSRRGVEGTGPSRVAEADRLLRRIDWLIERLQQADTVPERERTSSGFAHLSALNTQLAATRRQYENVLQLATNERHSGSLSYGLRPADVTALRNVMNGGEALVQFLVTPERLITFAMTADTLVWVEVAVGGSELGIRARLAHDVAASRDFDPHRMKPLVALDEVLLEPVRRTGVLDGVRSLLIVPHASLVHVPFAALRAPDGRYLIEDFTLTILPSASALPSLRQRAANSPNGRTAVFAPFPERLPASRVEAVSVSRSIRRSDRKTGPVATERAVRAALGSADIVHIASHGILNESSPMFSRVELAAPQTRESVNDGRLEVHELLEMEIRSRLVFLSGCETAAGVAWSNSFRRGQDHATLAQAFLYAGARDVVATLWRIDDDGAAAFASVFYRWYRGNSAAEALARAQRETIREPRYRAPRYWAGYTLTGAGGPSPQTVAGSSVQLPYPRQGVDPPSIGHR